MNVKNFLKSVHKLVKSQTKIVKNINKNTNHNKTSNHNYSSDSKEKFASIGIAKKTRKRIRKRRK